MAPKDILLAIACNKIYLVRSHDIGLPDSERCHLFVAYICKCLLSDLLCTNISDCEGDVYVVMLLQLVQATLLHLQS